MNKQKILIAYGLGFRNISLLMSLGLKYCRHCRPKHEALHTANIQNNSSTIGAQSTTIIVLAHVFKRQFAATYGSL